MKNQQKFNALWFVVAACAILFSFSGRVVGDLQGYPVQGAIIGGIGGVIWGFVLGAIAWAINKVRSDKWKGYVANWVLIACAFNLMGQMGGGVYEYMYIAKALETSPDLILTLTTGPIAEQVILYFIMFNTLMETLLVPLAVLLNWNYQKRRKYVLIAALLFYSIRTWTYLYFAPQYFDFGSIKVISDDFIQRVLTRMSSESLRMSVMITEAILFVYTAFVPPVKKNNR